ncbi:hypothetical protein [Cellulomonas endometrii]|uniref:hypothetical protein n=1 Tax=Cellulomonas endometrii TaxID=3036301 RepID=UPI0024ADB30E|nr:hypothetical protein [Cellulomonas endometrii]
MTTTIIYDATPTDLRDAVRGIRERVAGLPEPRLYQSAVVLAVLLKARAAVRWVRWEDPAPRTGLPLGKAEFVGAMNELFGGERGRLVCTDEAPLPGAHRLLLDVFYDAKRAPLTLVDPVTKNSVKLDFDSPAWIWNSSGVPPATSTPMLEYNPINTMNAQNGIYCSLSLSSAVRRGDAGTVYATDRSRCEHRVRLDGGDSVCELSNKRCGSMGSGVDRQATKPRLIAPVRAEGGRDVALLPGAMESLVERATGGGAHPLPRAQDLSLVVAWCHAAGRSIRLDHGRINRLLGSGISLLTTED